MEYEGDAEGHGILEGLLHVGADAVRVVPGLIHRRIAPMRQSTGVITPPQTQDRRLVFITAPAGGVPAVEVIDTPSQGLQVSGVHGIGVSTPSAAAVADATTGFASDLHMPNGTMLRWGTKSVAVAGPGLFRFSRPGWFPCEHISF